MKTDEVMEKKSSPTTKEGTPHYERMHFLKMKNQNYRSGERVIPVKYDYDNIPRKRFTEWPSSRSIMILDDLMDVFQEFYGITIDQLICSRRLHWQSILRSHLFWFVRYYNDRSGFDRAPYRFDVSNSFITSMFAKNHPMSQHGQAAINLMLETDVEFRKSHDELFDLVEARLEKYAIGKY